MNAKVVLVMSVDGKILAQFPGTEQGLQKAINHSATIRGSKVQFDGCIDVKGPLDVPLEKN